MCPWFNSESGHHAAEILWKCNFPKVFLFCSRHKKSYCSDTQIKTTQPPRKFRSDRVLPDYLAPGTYSKLREEANIGRQVPRWALVPGTGKCALRAIFIAAVVTIQTPRHFYPFRAQVPLSEPDGDYWLPHVASSTLREPKSPSEPDMNKTCAAAE